MRPQIFGVGRGPQWDIGTRNPSAPAELSGRLRQDASAYRSQREAPHDRALRRAFKLRGKLGADGGIGDYVPKPKWMR
jgi:hypothetical protein